MPAGWAWSKINTIAFVTKLAGFEYTKKIAPNLCENGIPLFKGKNVQNSKIIYEFESFIPESVSDELLRSQINKKCILTPYVGTIGNIGIHNRPGKYHLGSNVGKIELYNDNVILLEEYIVSYLQSVFGYQQLTKHMKATAQASISIEAIRDVYIPIPPANEQLRMWEALSKALSLIECIENTELDICDLVSKSKSKILDLAIRGKLVPQDSNDEPASVLLDRIQAEKKELVKQGKIKRDKKESIIFKGEDNSYYEKVGHNIFCIDEELPFEIPDNWCWCRLNEISRDIFAGGDKPNICVDTPTQQCSVPVFSNGIDKNGLYGYTEKSRVSEPSITISARGTIGFCCIRTEPFVPIVRLITVIPLSVININYLKIVCDTLVETGEGSSIPQLTVPGIKPKFIPVPPITEQNKISNKVNEIFSLLGEIEKRGCEISP